MFNCTIKVELSQLLLYIYYLRTQNVGEIRGFWLSIDCRVQSVLQSTFHHHKHRLVRLPTVHSIFVSLVNEQIDCPAPFYGQHLFYRLTLKLILNHTFVFVYLLNQVMEY